MSQRPLWNGKWDDCLLCVIFSLLLLSTLVWTIDKPIQPLGKGAFGEVWLCEHKTKHVQVAVKKCLKIPGDTDLEELMKLWKREAKNMFFLSSPRVVTAYDTFEDEFTCFLVMEFCSRGNLRAHLSSLLKSGKCMTESVCLFCSSFSAVSLPCFSICL
jgi:serine/threonine protein kinase